MNRLLLNSIFIVTLVLNCFSCKNEASKLETESAIQIEGLTLNNNEKWIANEETHIGMKKIDSILKSNPSTDGKILGDALSKETSYIIKSCDMEGEAHDQLHVVLVPVLAEITDLKDIKKPLEVKKKRTTLKQLTATYFEYFKI
ncbi:hypothetical protein DFQ11_101981 [Winogradskyella epiphytica]|uniref:Uncharacterized protein n=1 Tax=Winogradskyella epiphytica TaxID=262005 RepID=A0A2V4Y3S6_9FLAO|nr:hypothetical protein [Winogradskyella epiphytica]PYE83544.1 hypothetical protein DFQ11_101981 [Winogradskyella epiphytica]GGW58932.1 hypothetical protein GCM10008085_08370 [Winogradskyella epiphytica]